MLICKTQNSYSDRIANLIVLEFDLLFRVIFVIFNAANPVMVIFAQVTQFVWKNSHVVILAMLNNVVRTFLLTLGHAIGTGGLATPLINDFSSLSSFSLLFFLQLFSRFLSQEELKIGKVKKASVAEPSFFILPSIFSSFQVS